MTSHTIWLTGLSRSGKTTIALGVAEFMRSEGRRVEIIEGSHHRLIEERAVFGKVVVEIGRTS